MLGSGMLSNGMVAGGRVHEGENLMAGQGFVGQVAHGMVVLQDNDPRTTGAKAPESVTYETEDPDVVAVAAHPDDQLQLTVLLLAAGATRVLAHVDPGEGDPFTLATDVEALERTPGEAVGGTFELGEFVEQSPDAA